MATKPADSAVIKSGQWMALDLMKLIMICNPPKKTVCINLALDFVNHSGLLSGQLALLSPPALLVIPASKNIIPKNLPQVNRQYLQICKL